MRRRNRVLEYIVVPYGNVIERCVYATAEHGRGQRDRDARVKIAPLAFELQVRLEADAQIEIAGSRSACARFALAANAYPRPVPDTGRYAHVHGARVAIVLDRKAPRDALIGLFERQR